MDPLDLDLVEPVGARPFREVFCKHRGGVPTWELEGRWSCSRCGCRSAVVGVVVVVVWPECAEHLSPGIQTAVAVIRYQLVETLLLFGQWIQPPVDQIPGL